jgi:hypothetical protein
MQQTDYARQGRQQRSDDQERKSSFRSCGQ